MVLLATVFWGCSQSHEPAVQQVGAQASNDSTITASEARERALDVIEGKLEYFESYIREIRPEGFRSLTDPEALPLASCMPHAETLSASPTENELLAARRDVAIQIACHHARIFQIRFLQELLSDAIRFPLRVPYTRPKSDAAAKRGVRSYGAGCAPEPEVAEAINAEIASQTRILLETLLEAYEPYAVRVEQLMANGVWDEHSLLIGRAPIDSTTMDGGLYPLTGIYDWRVNLPWHHELSEYIFHPAAKIPFIIGDEITSAAMYAWSNKDARRNDRDIQLAEWKTAATHYRLEEIMRGRLVPAYIDAKNVLSSVPSAP